MFNDTTTRAYNSTRAGPNLSVPSASDPFEVAKLAVESTVPVPTSISSDAQDPPSLTIIFGVIGVLIAVIGLAIAALQLRHMYQRKKNLFDAFQTV